MQRRSVTGVGVLFRAIADEELLLNSIIKVASLLEGSNIDLEENRKPRLLENVYMRQKDTKLMSKRTFSVLPNKVVCSLMPTEDFG